MWCFNEGILFIYYSLINSLIFDRYSYMSTNIGLVSDRMKSWLCSIVDVDSWRPNKHAMIPVILLGNALPGADASSVHCNVNSLRTKNRQAPGCAQNLRRSFRWIRVYSQTRKVEASDHRNTSGKYELPPKGIWTREELSNFGVSQSSTYTPSHWK